MPRFQPSLFDPLPESATEEMPDLRATSAMLTEVDMLCIVTGMSAEQGRKAIEKGGGVRGLARCSVQELQALEGVGPKRAAQIATMTAWAIALSRPDTGERKRIRSPADIANLLLLEMGLLEKEELRVIGLNTKNQVVFIDTVYKGSVNTTVVRIGEVLREAVRRNCPGLVLAHNHPSGDPTPSPEDVHVTELAVQAGDLLGIAILDHLVIGCNRYVSLKEKGLGFR